MHGEDYLRPVEAAHIVFGDYGTSLCSQWLQFLHLLYAAVKKKAVFNEVLCSISSLLYLALNVIIMANQQLGVPSMAVSIFVMVNSFLRACQIKFQFSIVAAELHDAKADLRNFIVRVGEAYITAQHQDLDSSFFDELSEDVQSVIARVPSCISIDVMHVVSGIKQAMIMKQQHRGSSSAGSSPFRDVERSSLLPSPIREEARHGMAPPADVGAPRGSLASTAASSTARASLLPAPQKAMRAAAAGLDRGDSVAQFGDMQDFLHKKTTDPAAASIGPKIDLDALPNMSDERLHATRVPVDTTDTVGLLHKAAAPGGEENLENNGASQGLVAAEANPGIVEEAKRLQAAGQAAIVEGERRLQAAQAAIVEEAKRPQAREADERSGFREEPPMQWEKTPPVLHGGSPAAPLRSPTADMSTIASTFGKEGQVADLATLQAQLKCMNSLLDALYVASERAKWWLQIIVAVLISLEIFLNTALILVQNVDFTVVSPVEDFPKYRDNVVQLMSAVLAIIKGLDVKFRPEVRLSLVRKAYVEVVMIREKVITMRHEISKGGTIDRMSMRHLRKTFVRILPQCSAWIPRTRWKDTE
eukprot:TRINITY_DN31030_c0_g1_i1.p1 TRINITY_DN31030_c0_g1~~TRINITY_DN31030_c0_g1_i1.p1  ORF type:complete len:588 (-),score=114.51 TRINITY_DN31030_c0_g1_i1:172-1935(-)